MTKPFSLSKRILFGAFLPLALIVVLFVGAFYVINQQLAAQKISDYSWQFDELKNGSLRFKHIDFSFNKQLDVRLENIQISPKDSTTKNDTFAFLSLNKIDIGLVKITILNTHNNQTNQTSKLSIKETIETLKSQLTALQNKPKWPRKPNNEALSGCSVGGKFSHFGPPTEPNKIASACSQPSMVDFGSAVPWLSIAQPPTSKWLKDNGKLNLSAAADITFTASCMTSGPIPSPAKIAILDIIFALN